MQKGPVDILALGAHPDDIEFGCGGILAKAVAQGHRVLFVDLTRGEMGSNGTPEIRDQEAQNAAKVIGSERICLNFKDCQVFDTYEGRLELVKLFRTYKPKLILAPMWKGEMNHPDHIALGLMARYACRYARFKKILPELPPYAPSGILHYLYPGDSECDFLIDVSDYVEPWLKMMQAHESQHLTFNFSDWNLKVAARLGVLIDRPYAQGLIKGNPLVFDDVMDLANSCKQI